MLRTKPGASTRKNSIKIKSKQKITKRKLTTTPRKIKSTPLTSSTSLSKLQLPTTSLLASSSQLNATNSLLKTSKRTNYSFMNISGPKDDRYLDGNDTWVPPKAVLFDNNLVFASIILERPPICLKELPAWEQDWYQYRHSKLSEKAWVLPKDLEKNMYGKYGLDQAEYPEALPHITDDDLKNNRRSLYRALEDPVYFICKVQQDFDEKLPKEIWMFPTTQVRKDETVRTAAERTLFYHGGDLEYYTLGNAPILYHPVRNSEILKKEYPGAKGVKNFYMHSLYIGGNVELEPGGEITDFAWVTQPELAEYFDNDHCRDLLKMTSSSLYYLHPE